MAEEQGGPRLWRKGLRVRVRNRFTRSWSSGFEVEGHAASGRGSRYWIRRHSDGSTLPSAFDEDEVAPEDSINGQTS
jgi:hypothetical protein